MGRLPAILFLSVVCAIAQAQPMLPPGQQQDAGPDRAGLRENLQRLKNAGAAAAYGSPLGDEYVETLQALGYYDLLAEFLKAGIERNVQGAADRADAWRALGEAWVQAGPRYRQEALEAFDKALTLQPDDADALALKGHLFHREGLYEQAFDCYERALEIAPDDVRALLGAAVLQVRHGAIADASAAIDALGAAAQPYDVRTRNMLRKALYDFEQAGGWFDDHAANHAAYARLLYRAGRITDAMLAARRTVELDPDDYTSWNFIAAMQVQLGALQPAIQAYEKSLQANPEQPLVRQRRGRLMQQAPPRP